MKNILLLLSILPSFAMADVIDTIEDINWDVNTSHPYQFYRKADWRILQDGESGNCAAIAFTKYIRLAKAGIPASVQVCTLKSGTPHAFTVAAGRVLNVTKRTMEESEFASAYCADSPKAAF